jgi:DGQHR domain-containing protein
MSDNTLTLPAIEFRQGEGRRLYSFAIDAKMLDRIAAVSRIARDANAEVAGYQRPEVGRHIRAIRDYVESDDAMIPNALVIAFDSRVRFTPIESAGTDAAADARHGTITVPLDEDERPGFIVDGQQRTAAIRDADIDRFLMPVTAFVTDSQDEQRTQFILVNSTKPLPAGLIHELLPTTVGRLPNKLERRRAPAMLLERLNLDPDSPFHGMIKTVTNPVGVVRDNSVLRMLEDSLENGVLYEHRDPKTGEVDATPALEVLFDYWEAVARVFPDAWGPEITPRRSRLVHGAGIVGMGLLMDTIVARRGRTDHGTFMRDLRAMAGACAWTEGHWEFDPDDRRPWNGLQNTSKDAELLKNYLRRAYLQFALKQAS